MFVIPFHSQINALGSKSSVTSLQTSSQILIFWGWDPCNELWVWWESHWLQARSGSPVCVGEEVAPSSYGASGRKVSSGEIILGSCQKTWVLYENVLECCWEMVRLPARHIKPCVNKVIEI